MGSLPAIGSPPSVAGSHTARQRFAYGSHAPRTRIAAGIVGTGRNNETRCLGALPRPAQLSSSSEQIAQPRFGIYIARW
jgi:hypothetical protein